MLNGKKVVALLPIKANSERVKGKNFRILYGKPLFKWILDTLLSIKEIDQVVINTDARNLFKEYGLVDHERLLLRDRKKEIQGDSVSMNLVLEDDIKSINADIYLMTHATNPLLGAKTIRNALNRFVASNKYDSLFSVNRVQTRFYRDDMSPVNHDPDHLIPTQNLEPWYEENSCLYIFTAESFKKTKARIGEKSLMFVTPVLESVDIDEEDDWVVAEALAGKIYGIENG
jgi:CMP-N-acetylneuraminic acid synthetase